MIAEEQDAIGSDFTPSESFFGDLSQLHIWDRVLTDNEIYDLTFSCFHEEGNVVAWSDFTTSATGRVLKTEPSIACQSKILYYFKQRNSTWLDFENKLIALFVKL